MVALWWPTVRGFLSEAASVRPDPAEVASRQPLIADKASDSQSLGEQLADQQIELIAAPRKNRQKTQTPDGRPRRG